MKQKFYLLILGMLCFCLAGCYNYKATMIVDGEKSMDFQLDFDVDIQPLAGVTGESQTTDDIKIYDRLGFSKENVAVLRQRGYEVTEDQTEYTYKVSLHKKFINFEDLVTDEEVIADITKLSDPNFKEVFFTKEKHLLKTTYKAHFVFDYSINEPTPDLSYYFNNADDFFDLKFNCLLASRAVTHNATEVKENEQNLTWKLNFGEKNDIMFSYDVPTALGRAINIIITCIIIIVIGIIGIIFYLKKRKNKGGRVKKDNGIVMEEDKSTKMEGEALSLVTNKKEVESDSNVGSFASSTLGNSIAESYDNKEEDNLPK